MRKYILLGLLAIGCSQKETSEQATEVSETIESPVESDAKPEAKGKLASEQQLEKSLHGIADRVRVYEVDWKYDKDSESAATLDYRIEFVKNGKVVKDFTGKIDTDRGAEWGLASNVMHPEENEQDSDPRFVEVSVGFAACGYVWNHFLFFCRW